MLINEYIAHALPIGSRTLIDRYHLDISSATVRNELSHLEEAGYLTSPHTSAGRVPTDFGYRTFVDELLDNLSDAPKPDILDELRKDASELDDLLDRTSQALARFTNCLAMVVPRGLVSVQIARITLVQLGTNRLLSVIVSEDGSVFQRQIESNEELSAERLGAIEAALNDIYAGSTIKAGQSASGSDAVRELSARADVLNDPLTLLIEEELYDCCAHRKTEKPHTLGIARLLDQPEFSDATRLVPIIEKLEDETILFHLFNEPTSSDLPLVRIGHENVSEELADVSVVAAPYGAKDDRGIIAVIGPTRMDYEHAIKAVRAAQSLLQDS